MTTATDSTAAVRPHDLSLLDGALDRIHHYGEEWGGGLASHAPMVAEALVHADRAAAIAPFLDDYTTHLSAPAVPVETIAPQRWRERLGDYRAMADWIAHFRREIDANGWQATVARWVSALAPGAVSAATHGLIRTSHAVRALAATESTKTDEGTPRHEELARGLGYWASTYAELPAATLAGGLMLEEVVDLVPLLTAEQRESWLISDRVTRLDEPRFVAAVEQLAAPAGRADARTSVLAAAGLGERLLASNPQAEIAFVHAVTAPMSVVPLLPWLTDDDAARLATEAAKAVLFLWAAYGEHPPSAQSTGVMHDHRGDRIDRAIETGDDHQIKLAVALADLQAATVR